ncbi:hypothetical protein C1H46_032230 [Malus baccata]|uniref:Uncharacterized protein n=1 Tax=Malus baccata TaxID=106549 RepID=A0A540L7G1_MALBA|nr:hypothetical protein C1H46_032230 [Malus baccata]
MADLAAISTSLLENNEDAAHFQAAKDVKAYCTCCHASRTAAGGTRVRGGKAFKGFEPVFVNTVKVEGFEFGISWLDGVEKVFMP